MVSPILIFYGEISFCYLEGTGWVERKGNKMGRNAFTRRNRAWYSKDRFKGISKRTKATSVKLSHQWLRCKYDIHPPHYLHSRTWMSHCETWRKDLWRQFCCRSDYLSAVFGLSLKVLDCKGDSATFWTTKRSCLGFARGLLPFPTELSVVSLSQAWTHFTDNRLGELGTKNPFRHSGIAQETIVGRGSCTFRHTKH